MLRNEDVYGHISTPYDLLISKEDYMKNISKSLFEIVDLIGKDVVDLGAGTGRLTCMAAPHVRSIVAVDSAADMLKKTAEKCAQMNLSNWKTSVSDFRNLSFEDQSVDVVMAGWSICYVASSNNQEWEDHLQDVLDEMTRVLRPDGKIIIYETMGTGNTEPSPPDYLMQYFKALEERYGFECMNIRTDYKFNSVEQAEQLCRDFFGDEIGDRIKEEQTKIVPECTGVWWRSIRKGQII